MRFVDHGVVFVGVLVDNSILVRLLRNGLKDEK
jgi:hypothetical protein